jgi:hypothetical protein
MGSINFRMQVVIFGLIVFSIAACSTPSSMHTPFPDGQASFDYLKGLEGQWVVKGGKEGPFGWEFAVTSRESVVIERLKVGTPTEMTTIYYLDDGKLNAAHYCQLKNQPRLSAVVTEVEGDLHFECNGHVGNTKSHAELHMHGVHFKKKDDSLLIWMDMLKNGKVAFQTSYKLVRANSLNNPNRAR